MSYGGCGKESEGGRPRRCQSDAGAEQGRPKVSVRHATSMGRQ
jgi:hypothetical protein